jgi:diadenosine tetraphosphatase ApaH/serine/threonine PP2A family protein phosphatase
VAIEIEGIGGVLFCHATPSSDLTIVTRRTPASEMASHFGNVAESIVVCGHTHMQFDRSIGSQRVINAGSVGMPFGAPGAYWLQLGPDIILRRTSYDLAAAAERIRQTPYPQAEQFATGNVLQPPVEDEMLARFTPNR